MKKQKQPFHYVANLKEVGAEIAVEFFPSVDLVKVYFVNGDKKHVLSILRNDPEHTSYYSVDKKTDEMRCYNVVFDEDFGVQPNDEIGDEGFENEEN